MAQLRPFFFVGLGPHGGNVWQVLELRQYSIQTILFFYLKLASVSESILATKRPRFVSASTSFSDRSLNARILPRFRRWWGTGGFFG